MYDVIVRYPKTGLNRDHLVALSKRLPEVVAEWIRGAHDLPERDEIQVEFRERGELDFSFYLIDITIIGMQPQGEDDAWQVMNRTCDEVYSEVSKLMREDFKHVQYPLYVKMITGHGTFDAGCG